MKVIIAGSRSIVDYKLVKKYLDELKDKIEVTTIVSGRARGVDSLGEKYAKENNINLELFPANWNLHGKAAGPIRNKQMGDFADVLICFWDGVSSGSQHMVSYMKSLNKPVYLFTSEGFGTSFYLETFGI